MTLWDILAVNLSVWWRKHRPHRVVMMTVWPTYTKPRRTNMVQRWAMRRVLELGTLLMVFKVNPFHPVTIFLTILTGTLVLSERSKYREKEVAMWGKPSAREWR